MKVGISAFPGEMKDSVQAVVEMVVLSEASGFSEVLIPDSQGIWKDPYIVLALCATKTRSIGLSIGVTNPVTRHPMVTARSILTIQELSAGRAILGLGAGDTSLKALNMKPATVGECARYIDVVRTLLDGKEASYNGVNLRMYNLGDQRRVPIYLAANGPRMLRLAGSAADGVIVPVGLTREYVQYVWHHVGEGLREAGRHPTEIDVCFMLGASLSADSETARRESRTYVAKRALVPVPADVSGISDSEREEFSRAYRFQEHMDVDAHHGALVPECWIDRFALAGTPDEVLEKLMALRSWGADHVILLPTTRNMRYLIEEFGQAIIQQLA